MSAVSFSSTPNLFASADFLKRSGVAEPAQHIRWKPPLFVTWLLGFGHRIVRRAGWDGGRREAAGASNRPCYGNVGCKAVARIHDLELPKAMLDSAQNIDREYSLAWDLCGRHGDLAAGRLGRIDRGLDVFH